MRARQPWWNLALSELKKDLDRKRRLGLHQTDRPTYNMARNSYLAEIRKVKMVTWRNFADDINHNSWGKAFKWAKSGSKPRKIPTPMRKANGQITDSLTETANLLLSTFFPREGRSEEIDILGPLERYDDTVNDVRVKAAIWRMNPNEAPGLDGITSGMLRKAWPILGEDITELFRLCLREATFPQTWKKANLVVLPKTGKKDVVDPKSYRPVCLLPTLSKAMETLVIQEGNKNK